jgi:hypothetical protein
MRKMRPAPTAEAGATAARPAAMIAGAAEATAAEVAAEGDKNKPPGSGDTRRDRANTSTTIPSINLP